MTRIRRTAFAAALATLALVLAERALGQVTVRPESDVVLAGASNINTWACRTGELEATIAAPATGFVLARTAESRVTVVVPVQSLKCGNGRMERDLYDALDVTRFPVIHFALVGHRVDRELTTPTRFAAIATGDITVAGVTHRVELPVIAERQDDGTVVGRGTVRLRMTDFGVKPPVALFGLIRARNEIDVSFRVLLDTSDLAALAQP